MSNSTQPNQHRHLYVDDDQVDEEGLRNLVDLVMLLDKWERELNP